jgi:rubrerythrin
MSERHTAAAADPNVLRENRAAGVTESAVLISAKTNEFIAKAKKIHRNKDGSPLYKYIKTVYVKAAQKVIITCIIHGDFEQSPNSHLSGHGCKKCADALTHKKQTMSQTEFIKRVEDKHPNKLDFSKTIYVNYKTPAIFICKACGNEFTRDPAHMLEDGRGHGCSVCNGGVKDDLSTFISKAKAKHGDKYKYHLVEYKDSKTKVKIVCENGHIFEQTPSHHINGDGCRKCRGYYRNIDDFISLSKDKFGPDSFYYLKSVFIDMNTPLTLICKKGHEFKVTPVVHLREKSRGGCIECAKSLSKERMSYTQEDFINLAIIKHNGFYIYVKVKYISSQEKVIIICPIHGEFEQTPASHLGGAGCRACGVEKCRASKLFTENDFDKIFEECATIHSNKYIYSDVYRKDGYLFIEITCEKHGTFCQRYDHHKRGHGCFKCVIRYSKQQLEWLNYLSVTSDYIQHAQNDGEFLIPITNMYADGYEPTTNTIYEFQGDFWHGNPAVFNGEDINPVTQTTYASLYEKTQRKITKIKELGYNVYEMWENDWKKGKNAVITLQRVWKSKH